jgi:phytoene dehydrogenase-like protein
MLELVGRSHLDPSLADAMEGYRWNDEALFGTHYALADRPVFRAEGYAADLPRALNFAFGYESSDDLVAHMEKVRHRELTAHGALHGSLPSLADPGQAPPGHHTAFGWHFVPSRGAWQERGWTEEDGAERAAAIRACYERYAPGFEDLILAEYSHSPADTTARVPSMWYGDRHHGSYHPDNWGTQRPHPALSGYRTPIERLYLCGATQHPGGSFTGSPGYNAAGVIVSDLGIEPWWQAPDARVVLQEVPA